MTNPSDTARPIRTAGLIRLFRKTDVTICIPAYQAAKFIDRTLHCAQGQSYGRIRILVSVDRSTDRTVDICRSFAARDRRIEIVCQDERLGWRGNVNALLDKVDTRFFFIYFHDDIILPQYAERLRRALVARPECASANCDMFAFGISEALRPGRSYEGSVVERILPLWGVPDRGTPLRSMVRSSMVGPDFRLPPEDGQIFTPADSLVVLMMAAGPAIRVPQTLYLHWLREEGLTGGWRKLPYETVVEGCRAEAETLFALIDRFASDPADRRTLKIALTIHLLRHLAGPLQTRGLPLPRPADLHPDSPGIEVPGDIDRFGPEIAGWLRTGQRQIQAAYMKAA